jgi:putative endonuclease
MLASRSRNLYTGVTNNLERRVFEHRQSLVPGFTERYQIFRVVHFEQFGDIREAIAPEKEIKGWRREKKIRLIERNNPTWADLAERLPPGEDTTTPAIGREAKADASRSVAKDGRPGSGCAGRAERKVAFGDGRTPKAARIKPIGFADGSGGRHGLRGDPAGAGDRLLQRWLGWRNGAGAGAVEEEGLFAGIAGEGGGAGEFGLGFGGAA